MAELKELKKGDRPPPLTFEVRHGLAAAVLIAGTRGTPAVLKERVS